MKKLIVIMLLLSLMLVACDKENDANKTVVDAVEPTPEVILSLSDMDAVKVFLETEMVDTFKLSELYRTIFLDLNEDGVEEMFIINDVFGPVACLTLEDKAFKSIPCEITADQYGTLVLENEFVVLEKNISDAFTYSHSKTPFIITEEGVLAFESSEIMLESKKIVDPMLMTYEVLSTTVTPIDTWLNYTTHTDVVFVDENGVSHDYKSSDSKHLAYRNNRVFDITTEENNTYSALSTLYESLKTYGTDNSLKTFLTVYEENDLETAINYFHDNRFDFTEGAREAYANEIIQKILVMQAYYLSSNFDAFDFAEIAKGEEGLTIFFNKNDAQQDAKDQSILGFYNKYTVTSGVVDAAGITVAFNNQDISNKIYEAILDSDLSFDKGRVKNYLIHAVGYDHFKTVAMPVPNVVIQSAVDADQFAGEKKCTLLLPLTLINEPITFTDVQSLKSGKQLGDFKISYLDIAEDNYNINLTGHMPIDGILSYDTREQRYYVDINQPAFAVLYYDFPNVQKRCNVLAGKFTILNNDDELIKMMSEETLALAKETGNVTVHGVVSLVLVSGFDQPDYSPDSIQLLELYVPE